MNCLIAFAVSSKLPFLKVSICATVIGVFIILSALPLKVSAQIDMNSDGLDDLLYYFPDEQSSELQWRWYDVANQQEFSLNNYGQLGDLVAAGFWSDTTSVQRTRVRRQFKGEIRVSSEAIAEGTLIDIVPFDARLFVGGSYQRDSFADIATVVRRKRIWEWRVAQNPLGNDATRFSLIRFGAGRLEPNVLRTRIQRLATIRTFASNRSAQIRHRSLRRAREKVIRLRRLARSGSRPSEIRILRSSTGRADSFLIIYNDRVRLLSRRGRLQQEYARRLTGTAPIVALWLGDKPVIFEQQEQQLLSLVPNVASIPLPSTNVNFISRVSSFKSRRSELAPTIARPTLPPIIVTATPGYPETATPTSTPTDTPVATATSTPSNTPTPTITPTATVTFTPTATPTPNQPPLGQVLCTPGDQAGELGSAYTISCSGAYELEGDSITQRLVNVTGDCPTTFSTSSEIQGNFSGTAGSCNFQVEACDIQGACGARSPTYTLHSYQLDIASNGAPTIDSNCNLRVPLSVTASSNVSGLSYNTTLTGLSTSGQIVDQTGVQGSLVSGGTLSGRFSASGGTISGLPGVSVAKDALLAVGVVAQDTNEPPFSVLTPSNITPGAIHGGVQLVSDRNGADCLRCTGTNASISAGENHTCAVAPDNTVWCWGDNTEGQLGNGTTTRSFSPVQVVGLSDISQVSAGTYHSCAVRSTDGTVWCWGNNDSGQLGNNSTTSSLVPVQVTSLTGVVVVDAGMDRRRNVSFSCALTQDSRIFCWGVNNTGRLGAGGGDSLVPVQVINLTNPVTLSVGDNVVGALQSDGIIKTWGFNGNGALGDGTTVSTSTPVTLVQPGGVTSVELSMGSDDQATLLVNETSVYERTTALNLAETTTTARTGFQHTLNQTYCALDKSSGAPSCAMLGLAGLYSGSASPGTTLGNGAQGTSGPPAQAVQGLTQPAVALSARHRHACVVQDDGVVRCWGANEFGKLGSGSTDNPATPVVAFNGISAVKVSQSTYSTCVISSTGAVFCSGLNNNGALGNGTTTPASTPVQVAGITNATEICGRTNLAGNGGFCAIDGTEVKCWGTRYLGNNNSNSSTTPVVVQGITDITPVELVCAMENVCVRASTGEVRCWGRGSNGEIGDGDTDTEQLPVTVAGLSAPAIALGSTTFSDVFCAALQGGGIECWGQGNSLGDGSGGTELSPVAVVGIAATVSSISKDGGRGNNGHICASLSGGGIRCWGSGGEGALGNGGTASSNIPVTVTGYDSVVVPKVVAGDDHTCALRSDGQVACWGSGTFSQHGQNVWQDFSTPQLVTGLSNVIDISAGTHGSCAVLSDNTVRCWGLNNFGQFGNGQTNSLTATNRVLNSDSTPFIARTRQCERYSLNP